MAVYSLLCQAESSLTIGMSSVVFMAAVVTEFRNRGFSAHMDSDYLDAYGQDWITSFGSGVELMSGASHTHEITLRCFFSGNWAPRPAEGFVVDLAINDAQASGDADYVLAIQGTNPQGDFSTSESVVPLPVELMSSIHRNIIPGKVGILLDLDPQSRLVGLVAAMTGGNITSAEGISLRSDLTGANVINTTKFWEQYTSYDVVVSSPGAGLFVSGTMGIPSIAVALNPVQETRLLGAVAMGRSHFKYIGQLSSLSDTAIRGEVRDLLGSQKSDLALKQAMHVAGLQEVTASGTYRIVEWLQRRVIYGAATRNPPVPIYTSGLS